MLYSLTPETFPTLFLFLSLLYTLFLNHKPDYESFLGIYLNLYDFMSLFTVSLPECEVIMKKDSASLVIVSPPPVASAVLGTKKMLIKCLLNQRLYDLFPFFPSCFNKIKIQPLSFPQIFSLFNFS